ncbi:MAG TPA: prolyl oligopeptidase family serine peptidase [Pyrinomonadaceae bacterium]|nr:prolyl oligopeptidase family serine peptidase [Pyrinomonadaceae bacterium]
MKLTTAILGVVICAACGARGPVYSENEFPARTVMVSGVQYGYRVYLPPDRKDSEKLPVMLYLHGSNRRGTDNQTQLADLYENIIGFPQNWQFIVVVPQCREDTFWAGPMMDQALAALDQTIKEFGGDENRLYLAGYSMGGFGVWQTAITHPNKFAALISVAGGVEPLGRVSDEDRALLSPQVTAAASAPDTNRAYAEALSKLPVWIVHGADDKSVPVDASRKLVDALKAVGDPDVNYIELAGVGHGSVVQAFSDPRLFEWLAKKNLIATE